MTTLFLSILFSISILSNGILFYQLKKKKVSKELALDARQLLNDLTRGAALVRVIPLDPEGLLYRSARLNS